MAPLTPARPANKKCKVTHLVTQHANAGFPFRLRRRKRGFVLVLMALLGVAMIGAVGLSVDMGRMFIVKNELQTFADAASLAAAVKLDGTSAGLEAARAAAGQSGEAWNIGSQRVTDYQLEFGAAKTGPWSSNPSLTAGLSHARVRVSVQLPLYFLPTVTQINSQIVNGEAIAGQIPQTSLDRGLEPYTVVSPQPGASHFGLLVGGLYDIQWPQFNGSRAKCSDADPKECFNSPPCADESAQAMGLVKTNWGSNLNGYWGSSSNNAIYQEVMNGRQSAAVAVDDYLFMTSGNKNAQAQALDDRLWQDGARTTAENTLPAYLSSTHRNGRRMLAIPVVVPEASGTRVVGFAAMMLMSDSGGGAASRYYARGTGKDPFCAVYAGPYVFGGSGGGGSTSSGAFKLALLQ